MTQQASAGSLKAGYSLDPRGYTRGATEVVHQNERMAASGRNLNRSIGSSNRSMRRTQFALQQLAFGVEDAASQFGTTGLAGAFRAAGNNVTQFFAIMNPVAGIIASVTTGALALVFATKSLGQSAKDASEEEEKLTKRLKERGDEIERVQNLRDFRQGIREAAGLGDREKVGEEMRRAGDEFDKAVERKRGLLKELQDAERDAVAERLKPFVPEGGFFTGPISAIKNIGELVTSPEDQLRTERVNRLYDTQGDKLRELAGLEERLEKSRMQGAEERQRALDELSPRVAALRQELGVQNVTGSLKRVETLRNEVRDTKAVKDTKEEIQKLDVEINNLMRQRKILQGGFARALKAERDEKDRQQKAEVKEAVKKARQELGDATRLPVDRVLRQFDRASKERMETFRKARRRGLIDSGELLQFQTLEQIARERAVREADPTGKQALVKGTLEGLRAFAAGDVFGGAILASVQIGKAVNDFRRIQDQAFKPGGVAAVSRDQFDIGALQRALVPDRMLDTADKTLQEIEETNRKLERVNDSVKALKEDPVG